MFIDISVFVGHLHPLLVHLPIGFLLLAILFWSVSRFSKFDYLRAAVSPILLIGFATALAACISGYVLSLDGDYEYQLVSNHKMAGFAVAIISGLLFIITIERFAVMIKVRRITISISFIILFLVLIYAGHQGASLTHGSDYLSWELLMETKYAPPSSVEEAMLFENVVQPLLSKRCIQCHGDGKRKGKLSLKTFEGILKGGKSGPAVVAGKLAESELFKRITLDPSHEKFMPADGKPPLTKSEGMIIKWWIEKGMAVKGKKFSELKDADEIKPMVASFLGFGESPEDNETELEEGTINPEIPMDLDANSITSLRKLGFGVRVMYHHPVMLDVTMFPGNNLDSAKALLKAVSRNIVWLNLSNNKLMEKELEFLPLMINLEKLRLEKNPIGNGICDLVSGLSHLEAVNLNETKVNQDCVEKIKKMPSVKRVYSWDPDSN